MCSKLKQRLTALVKQELAVEERRALELHLTVCMSCRSAYDVAIQTSQAALPPVSLELIGDYDFLQRREEIAGMLHGEFKPGPAPKLVGWMAGAAVLGFALAAGAAAYLL